MTAINPNDLFLTEAETARTFKRSRSALKRDRSEGRGFPYHRIPGSNRILYRFSECVRSLESCTTREAMR